MTQKLFEGKNAHGPINIKLSSEDERAFLAALNSINEKRREEGERPLRPLEFINLKVKSYLDSQQPNDVHSTSASAAQTLKG